MNHSVFGLLAILLLFISGCQINPFKKEPTPTPSITKQSTQQQRQIGILVEAAELAIQKDQLLYPQENSAHAHLSSILELDPANAEARRGFEKIVERYIQLSIKAIDQKQFNRAQSMLDRARLVDKEHPSIDPAQTQLNLISNSTVDFLKLNSKKIDAKLEEQISSFGLVQPQKYCRFLISAVNDKQGRLIYQKLKGARNNIKLNAQIKIRLPTQIERQCFNH